MAIRAGDRVSAQRAVDHVERHPFAIIKAQTDRPAAREQRLQQRLVDDDLVRSIRTIECPRHFSGRAKTREAVRIRLLNRVVEDLYRRLGIERSMDDIRGVSGDQLQRSTLRVRRDIDPELPQGVTNRIDLNPISDLPAALMTPKAFSQEAGDLSAEFLRRGIDAAHMITAFESHGAP